MLNKLVSLLLQKSDKRAFLNLFFKKRHKKRHTSFLLLITTCNTIRCKVHLQPVGESNRVVDSSTKAMKVVIKQ